MKSRFLQEMHALEEARCQACGGLGTTNDAELGDIYYKTEVCKSCNGTGKRQVVSPIRDTLLKAVSAYRGTVLRDATKRYEGWSQEEMLKPIEKDFKTAQQIFDEAITHDLLCLHAKTWVDHNGPT